MAILKIKDENGNWQIVRDPASADIANSKEQIGDIDSALDAIIDIQNSLIGGESV